MVQYSKYLELAQTDVGEAFGMHNTFRRNAETVGLCIGLLGALAVSSSTSEAQFQQLGAKAVRLAMLSDASVDYQDTSAGLDDESKSFLAAWNSPESEAQMTEVLGYFREVGCRVRLPRFVCFDTDKKMMKPVRFRSP